jgi:hypothetical protein
MYSKALYSSVNCILVPIVFFLQIFPKKVPIVKLYICFAQCVELGKNWFFYTEYTVKKG